MAKAIKDHLRDFIAILGLVVVGLGRSTMYIVQEQRLRIPVLEERPFELKAELETAQAVTPGQGQTVRVAGVRVGDIGKVELDDGIAVVTMDIDREFLPVYQDATILLRPKTGLKDMFLELDPGTQAAGEYDEGDTIPVANTAPDVNLDEVLQLLDSDTRAYLRLLLIGGGEGLERARQGPRRAARQPRPDQPRPRPGSTARSRSARRTSRNLIHNMNIFFGRVGQEDEEIAALIDSLERGARRDRRARTSTCSAPPACSARPCSETRVALERDQRARRACSGPTLNDLRPFARKLKPVNESLGDARPRRPRDDVKNKIRPFVRAARKPVRDLRPAAENLADATPRLTTVGSKLNKLFNMAAYNPNGASGCTAPPAGAPATATRATSTGSAGSPTSATAPSRPRTPTASTAAST